MSEKFIDLSNEEQKTEHNAHVVSSFIEHCKVEHNLDIPEECFETYFNA